jgi:hypothetical protein
MLHLPVSGLQDLRLRIQLPNELRRMIHVEVFGFMGTVIGVAAK